MIYISISTPENPHPEEDGVHKKSADSNHTSDDIWFATFMTAQH
jgi:hypothetical protein